MAPTYFVEDEDGGAKGRQRDRARERTAMKAMQSQHSSRSWKAMAKTRHIRKTSEVK
jgi:hypothetical protein